MRTANEPIKLSEATQAKLDSFMGKQGQLIYLTDFKRILKKYSVANLFAHSKVVGMITAETLENLLQDDTTMPENAGCFSCHRPIKARYRWLALNQDGTVSTLPDGETPKERGQAAILPDENRQLKVRTFCPVCQETFRLPEKSEWQSYIQAIRKVARVVEKIRESARLRREEAAKNRAAEKALVSELEAALGELPEPEPEAKPEPVVPEETPKPKRKKSSK